MYHSPTQTNEEHIMNILERAALLPESAWTPLGKDYYLPDFFREVLWVQGDFSGEWEDFKNFPLEFVWVNTHLCTDTQVGKKIYRYKGKMFILSEQEYRRDDENVYVIDKKVLKECIADFREMFGDNNHLKEISLEDPLLESCGYFRLKFSTGNLTRKAYYLPEGDSFSPGKLIPCVIVANDLTTDTYADTFRVQFNNGEFLKVKVGRVFFKEFEGENK